MVKQVTDCVSMRAMSDSHSRDWQPCAIRLTAFAPVEHRGAHPERVAADPPGLVPVRLCARSVMPQALGHHAFELSDSRRLQHAFHHDHTMQVELERLVRVHRTHRSTQALAPCFHTATDAQRD